MIVPEEQVCPLCCYGDAIAYHQDKTRLYLNCRVCDLVFVPPAQHLSAVDEKACYDLHNNQADDPGYRRFLDRLFSPMCERLTPGASGLDIGCGPGPTLSGMFEDMGHAVALYDPFYAPDTSVLSARYDFITLSEVIEHMATPGSDMDNLWSCLKPGGWLGIMTKRVHDLEAFRGWHYITDPTHISYFSEETFRWMTARWTAMGHAANLTVVGSDVVLIEKGH